MNEATTHKDAEVVKKFCPVCFLAVQGEEVQLGEELYLHSFAGCLMSWARMGRDTQILRAIEARKMADPAYWLDQPDTAGNYWARRLDSDVFTNVTVLDGVRGLVVKCGSSMQDLSNWAEYSFLPRAVRLSREAA
jgi:hypothetical protein